MKKTDVLIIGGSAAGIVTAVTGKNHYPDKNFLVIRKEKEVLVPCGIPYIFGTLKNSDRNKIPDTILSNAGIDLKIGEVTFVDQENKVCKVDDGTEISFDKLVFATGSIPTVPKWLKGAELDNVFTVPKNKEYLDVLIEKLGDCKKIVTIGGGFIGVEVSDEINKMGKEVTIVEKLPQILGLVFDDYLASRAGELLESRGLTLRRGVGVKELTGNEKVTAVVLKNGEELEADAVVLSIGYHPNVSLAEKSGLEIDELGTIKVDEYLRTKNHDIFAVGDCAGKWDFLTRKLSGIRLASTACAEARAVGMNLYGLLTVRTFSGTIAIFSTAIGDTGFGTAGLTENHARKEGFHVVTGIFEGIDKHPGTLPGTHKQTVKLVVAKDSGVLLGGEVMGGQSTGEIVNLLGLAIQNRMTVNSLLITQIGTHPMLTAPPTAYPIIKAAEEAAKKMKRA